MLQEVCLSFRPCRCDKNKDQEGSSLSSTIHGHEFEGVSKKEFLKVDMSNGDMLKESIISIGSKTYRSR